MTKQVPNKSAQRYQVTKLLTNCENLKLLRDQPLKLQLSRTSFSNFNELANLPEFSLSLADLDNFSSHASKNFVFPFRLETFPFRYYIVDALQPVLDIFLNNCIKIFGDTVASANKFTGDN